MRLSILNGGTDRAIFPNYLDFIHALTLPEFSSMKDVYQISNTFDYPFQIGMAFAVDPNNMTSSELGLLTCLRSSLPPLELLVNIYRNFEDVEMNDTICLTIVNTKIFYSYIQSFIHRLHSERYKKFDTKF